jgi:coenzyme F420-dependent glucose-6-phosphate dehydrogenase
MNEIPAGFDWPAPAEQLARTEEALTIITRLLDGETVDFNGNYFETKGARLYLNTSRRPAVYMSAFGPQAAGIAGRLADGVWTLADPRSAPGVIAAYRRGADEAGREPGEIVLQTLASWGESDDQAFDSAREWKATMADQNYTDPVHEPRDVQSQADEIPDAMFKAGSLISADPDHHVRKIKAIQQLGATAVIVMNVAGADPTGLLRMYGEHVLPRLREN